MSLNLLLPIVILNQGEGPEPPPPPLWPSKGDEQLTPCGAALTVVITEQLSLLILQNTCPTSKTCAHTLHFSVIRFQRS